MDEIEYKLNTNNSVLIVNAIDKLISTIKSKYKPAEREKFVLENEELKFLREKCSSKSSLVSLTACQGLLALVELGVLQIAHTMSTVITLLPSAHNYSAIISTMAGLLILDLRSRLVPGQPYRCQFSLRSPQHPFISVMEKNKNAEHDVLTQMHALCTHPDYVVSSNSLELLRPVFLWLTCNPQQQCSLGPWQLLLSLPSTQGQADMLLACISCQQINSPSLVENAFAAYSAVADNAIYQQRSHYVMALLPLLARISNELVKHGRDPRACYTLIERGFAVDSGELRAAAGLVVALVARNLPHSSALHLHPLCNLCLNIISKYEVSTLSLSTFVALSLQWLHLPSHLTASALKTAAKILETHQNTKPDSRLYLPNLKANKTFQNLLYTDSHLNITFELHQTWERLRGEPEKLISWLDNFESVDDVLKMELSPFFFGLIMENRQENWYVDVVLKALNIAVGLVEFKKEVSVQLLPALLYKIARDPAPKVKLACLKALPLMAKTKENVPTIVSVLTKLKTKKGVPTSFLIMLYASLAETQVRCFPYLQELLVEASATRPDDLKWEIDLARALAVKRICGIRASSHGLELVSVISSTLNRCTDKASAVSAATALGALAALWRGAAVAPPGAWRALKHKLPGDERPLVQSALCDLLSEIPALRAPTAEYDTLISEAARELWRLMAESHSPAVVGAACRALQHYRLEDYKLRDVPDIYRRTVKLPASYCKTPADAARNPEDVLDYIPCEIWPEVFKYTNQAALPSVVQLASALVAREIKGYRSGVYQARGEPLSAEYLPPHSVLRGLLECFRKQACNPSYDFPEPVLLAILTVLTAEYPRPLPPMDMTWVGGVTSRGAAWRGGAARLLARGHGPSARRGVDMYLKEFDGEKQESEILELFEILPILCRNTPPNTLRSPLERCLHLAYQDTLKYKKKPIDNVTELLFAKQMEMIKICLDCDKIHDANRTLLSQLVESYYNIIEDDNVTWPTFADTCCSLSTSYLERMTSPSSWWEASAGALRRAGGVRGRLAAARGWSGRGGESGGRTLVWLNELVDAHAAQITDQEYSLQCMLPALQAAQPDDEGTRDWLLQLMARTQVAFKESTDDFSKLYLYDMFALSVAALSGLAACAAPGAGGGGASVPGAGAWAGGACVPAPGAGGGRAARAQLLPAAVAVLCARDAWSAHVAQILEWLCHTRDSIPDPLLAQASQRALLSLRHTPEFANRIWTRLESYFGRHENIDD